MEEKKDHDSNQISATLPPKYYADVCDKMPIEYTDYSAAIPYG